MHFRQIVDDLKKTYTIHLINLSDFFVNDDNWLYNIIKDVYQEVYAPDDRLVFYFPSDQYLYDDEIGTLIPLFQEYVALFDISHCFIKIITEDEKVIASLNHSHQLYAIDNHQIECIISENVSGFHAPSNINNSEETVCALLWDEFYIDPSAEVFPCCNVDKSTVFVDMNVNSYMDILNSKNFRNLRKKMLNGQKDRNCELCYKVEKSNTYSLRMKANKPYKNSNIVELMRDRTSADGEVSIPPKRLVFGFRNTCNLKCVMCTGSSSSMIQKEEAEILDKTFQLREKLSSTEYKKRMDLILPMIETLEHIIFAAGEPLLIKEHYDILDKLVELKQWDITIEYYTNLTMLTYHQKDVVEYWKHFNNLNLYFSLDAMYERGEYVRNGIDWHIIEMNYDNITQLLPTANIEINSTIHLYNAFSVIPFHKKWIENNKILPSKLHVKAVVFPLFMTLQVLPVTYKEKLSKDIKEYIEFLRTYPDTEKIVYLWDCVLKTLWEADNSHLIPQFFDYTDNIDEFRGLSFDETFPEYADLRSYV